MAEDVDGVEDKFLGDTKKFVEQTLLDDYFNTFLQSACLPGMEFLLIKSKTSCFESLSSAGLSGFPNYRTRK